MQEPQLPQDLLQSWNILNSLIEIPICLLRSSIKVVLHGWKCLLHKLRCILAHLVWRLNKYFAVFTLNNFSKTAPANLKYLNKRLCFWFAAFPEVNSNPLILTLKFRYFYVFTIMKSPYIWIKGIKIKKKFKTAHIRSIKSDWKVGTSPEKSALQDILLYLSQSLSGNNINCSSLRLNLAIRTMKYCSSMEFLIPFFSLKFPSESSRDRLHKQERKSENWQSIFNPTGPVLSTRQKKTVAENISKLKANLCLFK